MRESYSGVFSIPVGNSVGGINMRFYSIPITFSSLDGQTSHLSKQPIFSYITFERF